MPFINLLFYGDLKMPFINLFALGFNLLFCILLCLKGYKIYDYGRKEYLTVRELILAEIPPYDKLNGNLSLTETQIKNKFKKIRSIIMMEKFINN